MPDAAVARAHDREQPREDAAAVGRVDRDRPDAAGVVVVRGDLLDKLGRYGEASAEFNRAASLTRNARERAVLLRRATLARVMGDRS